MPLVELPNGQQVDVPDNLTPEQKAAFAQKVSAMPKAEPRSAFRQTVDAIGGGLADLGRGALKQLGTMAEGAAAFNDASARPVRKPDPRTDPRSSGEMVESILPTPQDSSAPRQFLRAGLEGLGGAAFSGPTSGLNLAAGAAGGIGGEIGARVDPNTPIGRIVGSLVGGVAGGFGAAKLSGPRPQSASIAKEAIEGFTPEELNVSAAYQSKMRAEGQDMDLAQALFNTTGRSGNFGPIRDAVSKSSQGNEIQRVLRGQPQALQLESDFYSEGLPGTNFGKSQNANNLQQAATDRLKLETSARSAAVKDAYAKAGTLPEGSRDTLIAKVQELVSADGATSVLQSRAATLLNKLRGVGDEAAFGLEAARKELEAAITPAARVRAQENLRLASRAAEGDQSQPLSAKDVDTWLGEFRKKYEPGFALSQSDPKGLGDLKNSAGQLNKLFREQSPEIAAADDLFQAITRDKINPLKQGPVGALNQPGGYIDDRGAQTSKLSRMLDLGVDGKAKISEIGTTVKELAKTNPGAFESSFKGWLGEKLQQAAEAQGAGNALSPGDNFIAKVKTSLFDNNMRYQGMKDAVAGMATAQGNDPTEALRGLDNFRQLTKALSHRPESIGISQADIARLGGDSAVADIMRVASMFPVNKAAGGLERAVLAKTLKEFDTLLTTEGGMKLLEELARTPVLSKKAIVLLGTYGGTVGSAPGLRNANPPEQ